MACPFSPLVSRFTHTACSESELTLQPETRHILCDRNHSGRSLDQRFTAFVGDKHASTPARIKAPVCATNDRLDNKDIAFLDQHVAIAGAAILRCKERAIVSVAAPMHEHHAF